jgi:hypothetical protein
MPRGGRRPGAGRPRKGQEKNCPQAPDAPPSGPRITLRSVARAAAARYIEEGRDPLRVLIDLAFDATQTASIRLQAATNAAQFIHPKLTAQAVSQATVTAQVDSGAALEKLMSRLQNLPALPVSESPAPVIEAQPEQDSPDAGKPA